MREQAQAWQGCRHAWLGGPCQPPPREAPRHPRRRRTEVLGAPLTALSSLPGGVGDAQGGGGLGVQTQPGGGRTMGHKHTHTTSSAPRFLSRGGGGHASPALPHVLLGHRLAWSVRCCGGAGGGHGELRGCRGVGGQVAPVLQKCSAVTWLCPPAGCTRTPAHPRLTPVFPSSTPVYPSSQSQYSPAQFQYGPAPPPSSPQLITSIPQLTPSSTSQLNPSTPQLNPSIPQLVPSITQLNPGPLGPPTVPTARVPGPPRGVEVQQEPCLVG